MMLFLMKTFLLWTLCEARTNDIFQPVSLKSVKLGDSATIECHIKSEMQRRAWYKLTTGKRLQFVASFNSKYNLSTVAEKFHPRYSVKFNTSSSDLSVSAATWGDAGTYFCGVHLSNDVQFGSGTVLMLKGADMIIDSVVQHPESLRADPGDSVTLSCSVYTDLCAAEQIIVSWLKSSPHSDPPMFPSSGHKTHICKRTESGDTACVFKLLMSNLRFDDDGAYYCVVTACEHTLLGNGTKLDLWDDVTQPDVHYESKAVVFSTIPGALLALLVCAIVVRGCCQCSGFSACTTASSESTQAEDNVHHAASREMKTARPHRKTDNTWSECLFFSVEQ
ncbi:uncharacterized protein LOC117807613 [Notolabrus celidotus]|uniref:uncharacterized protein LOC117807613 n=1 Tax=Notolabrus celidotus TaxID=1203425 RepID=UPI00148F5074|nr:uncharacterized protein LOC117807613 [Notolabrus celidotus]